MCPPISTSLRPPRNKKVKEKQETCHPAEGRDSDAAIQRHDKVGFTLIELSIVIVIIGLIVGGVLVGKDLIAAAELRAQVTQIEKYNTAVNTFRLKYNCLPGDCKNAAQFGFVARGAYAAQGDGNKRYEGLWGSGPNSSYGSSQGGGENIVFWRDLSDAGLISESFSTATSTTLASYSGSAIKNYLPKAKVGTETYMMVWSGGTTGIVSAGNGKNYMSIAGVQAVGSVCGGCASSSVKGLTVAQAYAIDTKIDDGLPQSGLITAMAPILTGGGYWANWYGAHASQLPTTAVTAASSTTCYDNNNTGGQPQQYSMSTNQGEGNNCALSFEIK